MECYINPYIDYLDIPAMIARQRKIVQDKVATLTRHDVVQPGLQVAHPYCLMFFFLLFDVFLGRQVAHPYCYTAGAASLVVRVFPLWIIFPNSARFLALLGTSLRQYDLSLFCSPGSRCVPQHL